MNVLILTGNFGMGHNSAAYAIKEVIEKVEKDVKVEIVDLVEYIYPAIQKAVYKGFDKLVDSFPGFYNTMYTLTDKIDLDMRLSGSIVNNKIDKLMEKYKPKIIISTLPLCASTMSRYAEKRYYLNAKLITCITDISVHKEWITDNADMYLVPVREVKDILIANGVKTDRIHVVGVPVRSIFKAKKRLERKDGKKNILIMGGGVGLLPDIDPIMEELEKLPNVTVTIITGKNEEAYDELKGKYKNTEVIGFTKEIDKYMNEADFMISKAGGRTLFESIYSRIPMFVIQPFLAQEIRNAKFIEQNAIGKVVWSDDNNYLKILVGLINNEVEVENMRKHIKTLEDSAIEENIAEVMRKIIEEYEVEVK